MENISKNVLEKIRANHINPKPKWQLALMHFGLLAIVIVGVFLGALAMGMMYLQLNGVEWSAFEFLEGRKVEVFIRILPYLWLGILFLALMLAGKIFTKTDEGYRFSPWLIVVGTVVLSAIFGLIIYWTGLAQQFDDTLVNSIGSYAEMENMRASVWHDPSRGIIVGRVQEIIKDDVMFLDWVGKEWLLKKSNIKAGKALLTQGETLLVRGMVIDENHFRADQVRRLSKVGNKVMERRMPGLLKIMKEKNN